MEQHSQILHRTRFVGERNKIRIQLFPLAKQLIEVSVNLKFHKIIWDVDQDDFDVGVEEGILGTQTVFMGKETDN